MMDRSAWRVVARVLMVGAALTFLGAIAYWSSLGPAAGLAALVPVGIAGAALALLLLAWVAASMPPRGPGPFILLGAYAGGVVGAFVAYRAWTPAFFGPSPWIGLVMLLAAPFFVIFGQQIPTLVGVAVGTVAGWALWLRWRRRQ